MTEQVRESMYRSALRQIAEAQAAVTFVAGVLAAAASSHAPQSATPTRSTVN